MNLNFKEWRKFKVEGLFYSKIGSNIDGNKIDKNSGKNAYITRKEVNNGLDGFIEFNDQNYLNKSFPVITIGNETAMPFVQVYPFFTGTKVNILNYKTNVSEDVLHFISTSLRQHKKKYNYSFTINSTRLRSQNILLPITEDNQPDLEFMEEYIRKIKSNKIKEYGDYMSNMTETLKYHEVERLQDKKWNVFKVEDIFTSIQRGKRLTKVDQISGSIPYVSSTSMNNGIDNFIEYHPGMRKFENCLSLANSGSVGVCFYEPFKFIASDHITHLKNDYFNKYIYLFLASILNRLSSKYNFNREINNERLSRERIMLPVNSEDEPDYEYMEKYIKNIMIKKYKQYLEFK